MRAPMQHTVRPKRSRTRTRRRWTAFPAAALVALSALGGTAADVASAPPASAAGGQCTFPAKDYKGRPWSLKRVLLEELWADGKGEGVRVAVIDTGVDDRHPQLRDAVAAEVGRSYLKGTSNKKDEFAQQPEYTSDGTTDVIGHGTKVAGIIAARPNSDKTGFVGLAPEATIIPIQQNDGKGSGDVGSLADAINYAVAADADVINVSQDTAEALEPGSSLERAVDAAVAEGVVVVASAGNEGQGGNVKKTYPASFDNVIAVGSSDRNNERAPFSQSGEFVDIAAPGVDMVSTVPKGGHCADNGTSFSAPYVAGVAALLVQQHKDDPEWGPQQIAAQLEQTAERSVSGHDRHVGWGVIDPVRAVTEDDEPIDTPQAREGVEQADPPTPAHLELGETTQERNERLGTYAVISAAMLVTVIAGGSVAYRDWRRRRRPAESQE